MFNTLSPFKQGWLVGILDGEGYFGITSLSPYIQVQMTDRDTIAEVAKLFGRPMYLRENVHLLTGHRPTYRTSLCGQSARQLMVDIYPHLSARRQRHLKMLLRQTVSLLDASPLQDR